ncbi:Hypothetical_protein [Hexamita inflata]|uniref:Hypothetical_protein n=1 Tax=Hexamita inflata TaxID=28002 RepID=A0AA86U2Y3_9EUKA|nr:Hypothetical protein HINF_LOCUS16758 [Hexamita inflata]
MSVAMYYQLRMQQYHNLNWSRMEVINIYEKYSFNLQVYCNLSKLVQLQFHFQCRGVDHQYLPLYTSVLKQVSLPAQQEEKKSKSEKGQEATQLDDISIDSWL